MASNDKVVQVVKEMPLATLTAPIDYRLGGSSPAEEGFIRVFNDSTAWYIDYLCRLQGYDGGGLTFILPWMAKTAVAGTVQWEIGIRAIPDDLEDFDAAHTYLYNVISDTAASASGETSYPQITFTDGADMDSWAEGELAVVRVRRNPAGTDDMIGDAQLWGVFGKET